MSDTAPLGSTPAALRETLTSLVAQGQADEAIEIACQILSRIHDRNRELELRLVHLLRQTYGRRSEKIHPDQLTFLLEALAQKPEPDGKAEAMIAAAALRRRTERPRDQPRTKPTGRKPLPAHLPREEVIHRPAVQDLACPHCEQSRTCIGAERSEVLDWVPATFRVLVHVREKYACAGCRAGVVIAPLPDRVIDGGLPSAGLLGHVLVSKFRDHRVPRMHTRTPQGGKGKQCCDRDEGGPLGVEVQALASNHLTLRGLRVQVVSGEDTARRERVRYGSGSRTQVNRRRRVERNLDDIETGEGGCPGRSSGSAC